MLELPMVQYESVKLGSNGMKEAMRGMPEQVQGQLPHCKAWEGRAVMNSIADLNPSFTVSPMFFMASRIPFTMFLNPFTALSLIPDTVSVMKSFTALNMSGSPM